MALVAKIVIALAALYVAVLLLAFFGQRRLLYIIDSVRVAPSAAGLPGVVELEIAAPDGARLVAWHGKAKPGQPTLLYFHGNAGSLANRTPRIERFMAEGWGVLMMTYRGYGGSTGSPTEGDNIADAIRAYDALVARGVAARDIVLYGESLGSGVASRVALKRPAAGLILDAPFTSIADVAQTMFGALPVRRWVRDRYETARIIAEIKIPILIMHGTLDRTIPVSMGRALAVLAREPKTYVEFPNGGHSDLYLNGNDALGAVRNFLRGLRRT